MKISGSSRKDGITFYGENYAVSVQYDKKKDSYSYELYERRTEKAVQNVPVLRGLESLWNNQGVRGMLVLSAAEAVGWMFSKSRSRYVRALGKGIIGAQYGLVAVLMYRIFGWDGEVRRFHGAEHKAIGAYEKRQGRISVQEAEEVSRISRRCGTNFLVYAAATGTVIGILPLGHGTFQQVLTMGAAYELFRMPAEKCPAVKSVIDPIGDALQRKVTTREPSQRQLQAACRGLNLLLEAESGQLSEEDKGKYIKTEQRSWLDRLIG